MGWRHRWFAVAVALSGGGCALIAGYDFGKYGETGGAAAGGGPAGSVGSTSGPSSGSSGTSTTTVGASSSGGTSSHASSSSTGSASSSSGVIVLRDKLLDPEAIAVDTQLVYFTTNHPPTGPSTAQWVTKDGSVFKAPIANVLGAPAVAAGNSLGYAATWLSATSGTITSYNTTTTTALGTVMDSTTGVAAWGATVFFTTTGSKPWKIPPGAMPTDFTSWAEIAAGPIAADSGGVYWVTTVGHMVACDLGGTAPAQLTITSGAVYAIATDPHNVYWTSSDGGVYQTPKGVPAMSPVVLIQPSSNPTYGIAVNQSDGTVYYAQGSTVWRLPFPYGSPPVNITPWLALINPRGVAFDNANVFVADKGTSNAMAPDGRILKLPP
jgi:hypothetical protein